MHPTHATSRRPRLGVLAATTATCLAAFGVAAGPASAAPTGWSATGTHALTLSGGTPLGDAPAATPLRLTIGLAPQNRTGDLADDGALSVLRLGSRGDLAFHQSLKRDAKGEAIEFDIDPRLMEQFAAEASAAIRKRMDERRLFALVTAAETRPYVRMIVERMFPTLAVLSQLEIARGFEVKSLGAIA